MNCLRSTGIDKQEKEFANESRLEAKAKRQQNRTIKSINSIKQSNNYDFKWFSVFCFPPQHRNSFSRVLCAQYENAFHRWNAENMEFHVQIEKYFMNWHWLEIGTSHRVAFGVTENSFLYVNGIINVIATVLSCVHIALINRSNEERERTFSPYFVKESQKLLEKGHNRNQWNNEKY